MPGLLKALRTHNDAYQFECHISKLPGELLLNIFSFSIPQICHELNTTTSHNYPSEHTLDLNAHPWVFTRVCRFWASLATSYSALWATIIFPWCPSASQIDLALLQLDRSQDAPLSFHLGLCHPSDGQALVTLLFRHCHRWKSVYLAHNPGHAHIPDPSFPLLETLSCHTQMHYLFPCMEKEYFPRLRSLSFFEAATESFVSPPSLSEPALFIQLTHLGFSHFNYGQIYPLLQTCAESLISLELSYIWSIPTGSLLALPQLRCLCIHDSSPQILDALHCPSLEEFVFLGKPIGPQPIPSPLTMASLEVEWNPCGTTLPEFVEFARRLRVLKVHVYSAGLISDGYYGVERLFELLRAPTTCPGLEEISVHGLPPHPRITHQIIGFIQLVRSYGSSLRRASLSVQLFFQKRFQSRWTFGESRGVFLEYCKTAFNELRTAHQDLNLQVSYEYDRVSRVMLTTGDRVAVYRYTRELERW